MKILCYDQATSISGYSLFENGELIKYGLLKVDKSETNTLNRIKLMTDQIEKLTKKIKPDVVILENIQFQRNIATFKSLAQLQGMIMHFLNKLDICYWYIEPSAWKAFCKIKGRKRAEQKENTIKFVKEKYGIEVSEDEADAIGIGTWAVRNIQKVSEDK